jgi:hypothetical protein
MAAAQAVGLDSEVMWSPMASTPTNQQRSQL